MSQRWIITSRVASRQLDRQTSFNMMITRERWGLAVNLGERRRRKVNLVWSNRLGLSMKIPDVYLSGDQVEIDGAGKHAVVGVLGVRWKAYASGQEEQYAKSKARSEITRGWRQSRGALKRVNGDASRSLIVLPGWVA